MGFFFCSSRSILILVLIRWSISSIYFILLLIFGLSLKALNTQDILQVPQIRHHGLAPKAVVGTLAGSVRSLGLGAIILQLSQDIHDVLYVIRLPLNFARHVGISIRIRLVVFLVLFLGDVFLLI